MRRALVLAIALSALTPAARGEVELQRAQWLFAGPADGPARPKLRAISTLSLTAGTPAKGRVRAKVTLVNRGPAAEGVLLRYSLTARLAPAGRPETAVWAVPFAIDEKRVPKVEANKSVDVAFDTTEAIGHYLKRLHNENYRADQIRLDVMVFPRHGETDPVKVLSQELPLNDDRPEPGPERPGKS